MLARTPDQRVGIVLAIVCFVLMLATYQPKIGLMAVLLLIWCLDGVADIGMKQARHFRPVVSLIGERLLPALATFASALIVYYLSVRLTVPFLMG